eukprot:TRINITY_DN4875_c0_g1_i8.p1 TRINITY_DN4875_c0_g1~~TRINITY_DN4875_c0_g1_i8.p1  ORF type:complete len:232 (+),score=-3.86 TRINITY_DN4875_c0_g1_i8:70-696(+)
MSTETTTTSNTPPSNFPPFTSTQINPLNQNIYKQKLDSFEVLNKIVTSKQINKSKSKQPNCDNQYLAIQHKTHVVIVFLVRCQIQYQNSLIRKNSNQDICQIQNDKLLMGKKSNQYEKSNQFEQYTKLYNQYLLSGGNHDMLMFMFILCVILQQIKTNLFNNTYLYLNKVNIQFTKKVPQPKNNQRISNTTHNKTQSENHDNKMNQSS